MADETYQPMDRRPITSRERPVWQAAAKWLAHRGISPNVISVAGMMSGVAAGVCLALTPSMGELERVAWLAAAVCIQLRLLANMLDGMVAIESSRASPLGELFNEMPDRVSDVATLIGAGYAVGGGTVLGYIAACMALFVAYVRAVGKAMGAANLFVGPMAKQHRMFTVTLVAMFMALAPGMWRMPFGDLQWGLMAAGLMAIVLGGLVTALRRIRLIVAHLRRGAR
ncbi:MAG: CDP-alcohol phosphatidyltransferase family protein [Verrucomicrobia bacterium]|nr:CDP-alcohol phosphatidyltransferase family protein [Verrucomicrobiota bacterium]